MIIFNTTYKVSNAVFNKWLQWVREDHIPLMTEGNVFVKPQIARISGSDDEHGTSYSVQFHISNVEQLENWYHRNGSEFERSISTNFGTEVLHFSTILELID